MSKRNTIDGLHFDEPMSRHTSWRVGGPADMFFEPQTDDALVEFLASLPEGTPVHFIGLGSNLLVRDGGVRGAVVSTRRLTKTLERIGDTRVRVGAGVPCARLARQCVRWQLGPAAFLAGIPGTVGGALTMNAGAFGGETWERVEAVEMIDRRGGRHPLAREAFDIGYRTVRLRRPPASGDALEPFFFLSALLRFEHDASLDMTAIRQMLDQRAAKQPLGVPSCGSVFRNPEGTHAGALIERAGLKGLRVGAAEVSEKHANFILNTGGATAADIETLIETVRARVAEHSGVRLECEVRMIGEALEGQR